MPRRALILGITGQDGSYLAELLLSQGYEVIGMVRRSSTVNFERIAHIQDRSTLVPGDILDEISMIQLLREHRPHEVYNLAAQSFVQTSWSQPVLTGEVTALGVTRILDAIRLTDPEIRFYQASSSEMFGKVVETPQRESTPFYPRSPYGVAKVYGHWITVNYRESYQMHASSGILFNHESPRRGIEFLPRKVSHGVARIKLGLDKELRLGNLDSQARLGIRGRLRPRDVGRCFSRTSRTTTSSRPGRPTRSASFARSPSSAPASTWKATWSIDERFLRPAEVDVLVGDATRARERIGWQTEVGFEGLVQMMVDADIDLLRSQHR